LLLKVEGEKIEEVGAVAEVESSGKFQGRGEDVDGVGARGQAEDEMFNFRNS